MLKFFGATLFVFLFAVCASAQSPLVSAEPPKNPEIAKGVEAALKGDVADAEKFFADATTKNPGSRPGGIDAAMAFTDPAFEFQHFGKLRFWLEKTTDDYPNDPEAFLLLGDIAIAEGRLLEAKMLAEHAAKLVEKFDADRKKSLQIYAERLLASVAEQKKNWNEALSRFTKLCELEPTNGEHPYRLGLVLYRLDRKDDAVKSLTDAASKNNNVLPPLLVLAQLAESEGKTDEAVKLLAESLEKDAENSKVLASAADLELRWNHLPMVRELCEKAQKLDPKAVAPRMTLGIVDLYDGKFTDAEEKFSQIVSASPEDSSALIGLSLSLCEQSDANQLRRAYGYAKSNADKNPESVDTQATLAWVLVKANYPDEAEKILTRLFDVGDLNSPGAYYLAVIYSQQNRQDEAILFLKSALETKINFPKRVAAETLLKHLTEE
jgi:tetratricopeptide (TPR) repeat protein